MGTRQSTPQAIADEDGSSATGELGDYYNKKFDEMYLTLMGEWNSSRFIREITQGNLPMLPNIEEGLIFIRPDEYSIDELHEKFPERRLGKFKELWYIQSGCILQGTALSNIHEDIKYLLYLTHIKPKIVKRSFAWDDHNGNCVGFMNSITSYISNIDKFIDAFGRERLEKIIDKIDVSEVEEVDISNKGKDKATDTIANMGGNQFVNLLANRVIQCRQSIKILHIDGKIPRYAPDNIPISEFEYTYDTIEKIILHNMEIPEELHQMSSLKEVEAYNCSKIIEHLGELPLDKLKIVNYANTSKIELNLLPLCARNIEYIQENSFIESVTVGPETKQLKLIQSQTIPTRCTTIHGNRKCVFSNLPISANASVKQIIKIKEEDLSTHMQLETIHLNENTILVIDTNMKRYPSVRNWIIRNIPYRICPILITEKFHTYIASCQQMLASKTLFDASEEQHYDKRYVYRCESVNSRPENDISQLLWRRMTENNNVNCEVICSPMESGQILLEQEYYSDLPQLSRTEEWIEQTFYLD